MVDDIARLELLARDHLRQGNVDAGIDAFRKLVAVRAGRPDDWYNLGYLERCARQFEAALQSYGEALALNIDRPEEVHLNRAAILSDHLERPDDARFELEAAVRINAAFLPAWLNLGMLHEDSGNSAAARAAYRKALEIAPANGRAHARLAAIDMFEKDAAGSVDRLLHALRKPGLGLEDIAEIQFALANALDATGRYDDAFATIRNANKSASRLATQPPYDPRAHQRLIAELRDIFADQVGGDDGDDAEPIFICGLFRSGSTLAEHILARHHRVTAGGEIESIPAFVHQRLRPYPASLRAPDPDLLASLRRDYLSDIALRYPDADIVTDKRPDNFLHIGLIKALFPRAKIIHTVRNPLDNLLSMYFLHFADGVNYSSEIEHIVHYIGQYRILMNHWKSLYGNDIHDLDYDILVSDPEPTIRSLLDFCRLDWDPNCAANAPISESVKTASGWQVRQPLHGKSSGRWRNYGRYLKHTRATLDLPSR